jgi:hypothetical protein
VSPFPSETPTFPPPKEKGDNQLKVSEKPEIQAIAIAITFTDANRVGSNFKAQLL